MSFWDLNVVFVGIALVVLLAAVLTRRMRGRHLAALGLALAALWVLTAIFDNVMIAAGLFDYGHELLSGVYLGLAPLEDFAYPFAGVLLLPALWLLLGGARARGRACEGGRVRKGCGAPEGRGTHPGRGVRGARVSGMDGGRPRAE